MKLLDIILEDEELPQLTVVDPLDTFKEKEKQRLINSPYTTGLTFDNVEVEKRENPSSTRSRTYIKDYGCKIHNDWFKKDWSRIDSVLKGDTGCEICGMDKIRQRAKEFHTKPEEIHKQDLINSPYTTGLTFNNVEFERIEGDVSKNVYIKNYSCKKHPEWFKDKWTRIDTVKSGDVGCTICGVENHFKPDEKLKQGLINSEYTTGLTFNNVEFKRDTTKDNTNRILIKNYGCKKHRKWFKDKWVYYGGVKIGAQGCDLCAVENSDNLKGWLSDTWTGKFTDNVGYNEWIVKRNKLLQKNWLKTSKETHKNIKYDYSMVDFNDPNTISYVYDPDTKEYKRKPKSGRQFLIGCPVTNHGFFIQDANHHKRGTGCPICRQSRGELYLANLFTSNKIKHLRGRDTKFEKLIGKKYGLISDFYLPKQKVFVEYDGEQHFRPSFGSTESSRMNKYTMTYENDNARNDFAKTNNEGISLIRIPYTMEFADIDKVLMRTIRYIKPNTVVELGDYPKRMKPKKILSKHQVDLTKPIRKKIRTNESKLSLMGLLGQI